jgi:elongation factor Ts
MPISAELVSKLRQETGAGVMDCKRSLEETRGNYEKAKEVIRKKGLESAEGKAGKATKAGRVGVYVHGGGVGAAMVELTCETDFVAKNEEFQDLLKELAVAVYGFGPLALSKEDLPLAMVEEEKKKYEEEIKGKPPAIAEKIVEGKLEKNLFSQKCLLHMTFPKEDKFKGTYGDFIKSKIAILKENIVVRRFHRLEACK